MILASLKKLSGNPLYKANYNGIIIGKEGMEAFDIQVVNLPTKDGKRKLKSY